MQHFTKMSRCLSHVTNNSPLVTYNCLIFAVELWNAISLAVLRFFDEIKQKTGKVQEVLNIEKQYVQYLMGNRTSHRMVLLSRLISWHRELWWTPSPERPCKPNGLASHNISYNNHHFPRNLIIGLFVRRNEINTVVGIVNYQ